ncbi:Gfo/Idh/MocA family protein [Glaciecola sp. SC05]|uniref:Gfo/Idh/MocA family protein n=1 Tax=Glaciecola sp. SC05 TaxID=1987355 RepID=UPI0035291B7E
MKNRGEHFIRWGILGCGNIASTFAQSIGQVHGGELCACAAGEFGRASMFAKRHKIKKVHTDYSSLVADNSIDAIYIATTHNFHFEQIMLCLANHKHVLCEKPITINAKQARQVQLAAQKHNLLVLEAVWTRFLPAIEALQNVLKQEIIGNVKSLYANFSINLDISDEHRLLNLDLAGGALLDLGIYPITMADIVFQKPPTHAKASALMTNTGVDELSSYMLNYAEGQTALLSAGFRQCAPTEALIFGDKGYIRVPNFLGAKSFEVVLDNQPTQYFEYDYKDEYCFQFEINHFHRCLEQGLTDSPVLPLAKSFEIVQLMDILRAQFNLVYAGD